MTIKVLASHCAACQETYNIVNKAVINLHRKDLEVILINDIMEIMNYHILTPPAIVINEKVVYTGHIHSEKDALQIIEKHISPSQC